MGVNNTHSELQVTGHGSSGVCRKFAESLCLPEKQSAALRDRYDVTVGDQKRFRGRLLVLDERHKRPDTGETDFLDGNRFDFSLREEPWQIEIGLEADVDGEG